MLGVIAEFQIDCSQLHNDSTSIALHGAYARADGRQRAGKPTAAAALGHSKDHRPDLKQFLLTLTVTADGAVPLAHRLLDGNSSDDQTHIATWDGLVDLVGRPDFLYVADSKARHARADGPHPLPRRAVRVGAGALARRGLTDPRMGPDPPIRLDRGMPPSRQAQERPGLGLVDGAGAGPDRGGPPHRLGALIAEARARRRVQARADRARDARPGSHPGQARRAALAVQDTGRRPRRRPGRARRRRRRALDRIRDRRDRAGGLPAKRSAAGPGPRPATARPRRPASRSASGSTTTRSPTTPPPTASSRSSPTTASSPTPSCSPPTATSPTSSNATTSSRPCSQPHRWS